MSSEDHVEGQKQEFDNQDLLGEASLDNSNSLLSILTSLSANMDCMASSMTTMGELVAALSQQPRPAKRDSRAGNVDPQLNKRKS